MLLIRFLAIGVVLFVAVSVLAFLATRNRRYLRFAMALSKWSILVALLMLLLMAAERLLVIV